MFPYFQKLNIGLPDAEFSLDATKMKVLHYYAAAQKHSLRAKKQFENYVAIPNATYIPREEDVATLLPLLPADLIAIESPELWCMNIKPQHKNNVYQRTEISHAWQALVSFLIHMEKRLPSMSNEGSNLVKVASFVAQHGDVYLLNVDKVHDVKLAAPHIRKSLGFSFITTPFETVYDQLRKAELISGHELP